MRHISFVLTSQNANNLLSLGRAMNSKVEYLPYLKKIEKFILFYFTFSILDKIGWCTVNGDPTLYLYKNIYAYFFKIYFNSCLFISKLIMKKRGYE